ncbi:TetR/AcrR family transcriptional regulator [Nonomuraea sp. ZG12]|uniref:TetR/AcrR family transcriptional regulator n=1 Tax=Nonomuraea sp. ZG12 TaxID=3452207 RepID=UPI003F8B4C96
MMSGLRQRKKEQTRLRIAEVALRLFDERGYDAVTVNEVAEAAGVAKVTLFSYFPTKDCLVLDGIQDDPAGIVAGRRPGQSPLDALREHYRAVAAQGVDGVDVERLLTQVRVVSRTPALMAGVYQAHMGQRYELAAVLQAAFVTAAEGAAAEIAVTEAAAEGVDPARADAEAGEGREGSQGGECVGGRERREGQEGHEGGEARELAARIMAGQITATLTTVQEAFFHRLAAGMPLEEAGRRRTADVELAFDLLENGLKPKNGDKS